MKAICNNGHESFIDEFNNETKEWRCPECNQLLGSIKGDGYYSEAEDKLIVSSGSLSIGGKTAEVRSGGHIHIGNERV